MWFCEEEKESQTKVSLNFIYRFKRTAVRLGEYDISTTEDGKHGTIRVDHAIAHKKFHRGVGINDIALVFLVEDVEFTGKFIHFSIRQLTCYSCYSIFLPNSITQDRIRPICLPTHGLFKNHDFAGMNPFLAGKYLWAHYFVCFF